MRVFRSQFFHLILFLSVQSSAFTVVLDPGHGGIDGGASRGSFIESQIVYQIAEKTQNLLKLNPDIEVALTRKSNKGLSLSERVQFAQIKKADLFLSLHANSSSSNQVTGMEYYFGTKTPAPVFLKSRQNESPAGTSQEVIAGIKKDLMEFGKMKSSLELSQKIQSIWNASEIKRQQISSNKIRRAPFYVIENTSMPSVLIEVGFISNQREARKLVTNSYQDELAHALTEAIVNFKEKSDK